MASINNLIFNQPDYNNPVPTTITTTGSQTTMTINGSLLTNGTITVDPSIYNGWSSNGTWGTGSATYYPPYQSVVYPTQSAIFKIGEGSEKDEETLISKFSDIVGDEMQFIPVIDGKKVEPLETVMKYVKSQKKMDFRLTRVGYEIILKGVRLKSIRNLLSKDSDTVLKVVFEYDEMVYDNTLLTLEEKRAIKVKELAKNIKKNDI
jgi:hypothetical protein